MTAATPIPAGVEWRPIPGYEGMYEVSSAGQVRSLARNQLMPTGGIHRLPQRVMVTTLGAGGYPRVTLSRADGAAGMARSGVARRGVVRCGRAGFGPSLNKSVAPAVRTPGHEVKQIQLAGV